MTAAGEVAHPSDLEHQEDRASAAKRRAPYARRMDDNIAGAIIDDFFNHFKIVNPEDIRAGERVLATIRMLPEPEEWVLVPDGENGEPKALLLVGDRLIEVWSSQDDSGLRVKSESRPLVDAGVMIGLESFDSRAHDSGVSHRTEWRFKFPGDYEVLVPGRVTTMPESNTDDREKFARAVATKVGWAVVPARRP